ncbi:hypothetical protein KWC22_000387 [Salmonella enterica]|nr:hypothetical protein [Salmonella enterica]EIA3225209.1 hypothetical protein [Salmonella enterica]EJB6560518.1 hypothetical protein [Salmonella enterica]EKS3674647.1 hypothetical protein [Salmonella enterica]ELW6564324.1 hypothetical protein [Salmonella enterica]
MKPEHLHRLTGRDVLRYRRIDPLSRALLVVTAVLAITFILLLVRTA